MGKSEAVAPPFRALTTSTSGTHGIVAVVADVIATDEHRDHFPVGLEVDALRGGQKSFGTCFSA